MAEFHFLRPAWLLLLPLLLALLVWLARRENQPRAWANFIAPALLAKLQQVETQKSARRWPWFALCWLLAVIALAGPSWQKLPSPVAKSAAATVFLLDLSPSMLAEDLKPSRIVRAQQKLTDALSLPQEGLQALIAYAGDAHLVAPLTDDARTLRNLVPALTPSVMPMTGSNVEMAVELAINTLRNGHIQTGRLLLFTDGITKDARDNLIEILEQAPYPLYIIGLGDESGAPIPLGERGFAKDRDGNIVIVKNERKFLREIAAYSEGQYRDITLNDDDIRFLAAPFESLADSGRTVERDFDQWRDEGIWLVWLLLPLAAYGFRKHWLLTIPLLLCLSTLPSQPVMAQDATGAAENAEQNPLNFWDWLWRNPDQRGRKALEHDHPAIAAQTFKDPRWQASALYRAQQYQAAIDQLTPITQSPEANADDFYNLGNAQARAGQIDAAIQSYREALQRAPDMADAKENLALLEALKQQENTSQENRDQNSNPNSSDDNPQQNTNSNGQNNDASEGDNPQAQSDTHSKEAASDEQSPAGSKSDAQENAAQGGAANAQESSADEPGSASEDKRQQDEPLGDYADSNLPDPKTPDAHAEQSTGTETARARATDNTDAIDEQNAKGAATQAADALDHLSDEERQAMEQWLRQVEDDPTGLLRRKFEYQYRQRRAAIKQGDWQAPENDAHERW